MGLLHGLPEVMPPNFPWVMLADLLGTPAEAVPEQQVRSGWAWYSRDGAW